MSATAYLLVKCVHAGCAVASLAGFAARAILMLRGSPRLEAKFVRVAPHVVDTALLASALWLVWAIGQYPFVHGWLTAKVLALPVYVVLGSIALKRGRTRAVRVGALAGALAAAAYIVGVAITREAGWVLPKPV